METLKAYAGLIKLVMATVIIALISGAVWKAASDHYGKIIASVQAAQAEAVAKAQAQQLADAANREKIINDAGEQHAKDQLTINRLGAQLDGMRVHIPTGGCPMPQAGTSPADTGGASGVLSAGVDAAFERLQAGVGRLVQRCDQLNIDAAQANKVR